LDGDRQGVRHSTGFPNQNLAEGLQVEKDAKKDSTESKADLNLQQI
jgi:hypothetical protein